MLKEIEQIINSNPNLLWIFAMVDILMGLLIYDFITDTRETFQRMIWEGDWFWKIAVIMFFVFLLFSAGSFFVKAILNIVRIHELDKHKNEPEENKDSD